MSVQTYNELITMLLGEIFKNITNENSHNLFNQPLTINFLLNDPIFINNQFFIEIITYNKGIFSIGFSTMYIH